MDKIILKDLRYDVVMGQFEPERLSKQEIVIDLEFSFDMSVCIESDDVKDAICYDEVEQEIGKLLGYKDFHLLETMAEYLKKELFTSYPMTWLKILIKKPGAIKNAQYAAIEMTKNG